MARLNYNKFRNRRRKRGRIAAAKWDSAEDRYLIAHYYTMLARAIGKHLGRTESGVTHRAKRLGVWKQEFRPWTAEEKSAFIRYYRKHGAHATARSFKRTLLAVRTKAHLWGIHWDAYHWAPKHEALLKRYYVSRGASWVAQRVGHTPDSVKARAMKLGIRHWEGRRFSQHELEIMQRLYPQKGRRETARLLGRSFGAVSTKAHKLGLHANELRRWTKEENESLRQYAGTRPAKHIGKEINRSRQAVIKQIQVLHLSAYNPNKWTAQQKAYVLKHYKTKPYAEIAAKIGRTFTAVAAFLQSQGKRRRVLHTWTNKEKSYIIKWYNKKPVGEIARALGVSSWVEVRTYAGKLGLWRQRLPMHRWTEEEKAIVLRDYVHAPIAELAARIGVTEHGLEGMASRLGVAHRPRGHFKMPSDEKLSYIKEWYYRKPIREIAQTLGLKWTEVRTCAAKIGLRRKRPPLHHWTAEEKAIIRQEYLQTPIMTLANRFSVSEQALMHMAAILGVAKRNTSRGKKKSRALFG